MEILAVNSENEKIISFSKEDIEKLRIVVSYEIENNYLDTISSDVARLAIWAFRDLTPNRNLWYSERMSNLIERFLK